VGFAGTFPLKGIEYKILLRTAGFEEVVDIEYVAGGFEDHSIRTVFTSAGIGRLETNIGLATRPLTTPFEIRVNSPVARASEMLELVATKGYKRQHTRKR
jgi:hypothetical protein